MRKLHGNGMEIYRGEVVIVDLEPTRGSEQGGIRPALIIQNDIGNKYSPTTIIAPITSNILDKEFPTDVNILSENSGLKKESVILLNQIKVIDKSRIKRKSKKLDSNIMKKVDMAIKISLGIE